MYTSSQSSLRDLSHFITNRWAVSKPGHQQTYRNIQEDTNRQTDRQTCPQPCYTVKSTWSWAGQEHHEESRDQMPEPCLLVTVPYAPHRPVLDTTTATSWRGKLSREWRGNGRKENKEREIIIIIIQSLCLHYKKMISSLHMFSNVLKTSPGASVQVCYSCTHTTTMGAKGLNQVQQK